jgi:ABC-type transport system involved in Fe-S cluster assembly fused permease/ATPase subunit
VLVATNDFKRADRVYRLACRVISAAQGLVMTVGLLGGCFLAIYQVVEGKTTPGNFVMLLSYWAQLKGLRRLASL